MSLGDRQQWVLKSVVDTFVSTAEPVGSKLIAAQADSPVSSATVRNEMAELEAQGYLEQPHTSAGRVPTDKGYREYVDHLMNPGELPDQEKKELRANFEVDFYEVKDLLKRATTLLSESTGYATVTVTPTIDNSYITQVKMLSIEPGRVLIVVVLSAGVVRDRVARISDLITSEDLQLIARTLEDNLRGVKVEEVTLVGVEQAMSGVALPDPALNQILYETYVAIKQADQLDVYMEGVQKLFIQPEFREPAEVHRVYNALQTDGMITGYLTSQNGIRGEHPFMIRIGQEIEVEGMEACSLVTTTYQLGERLHGQIGVIGPRRMEYEKVIPRITFIRESVKQYYDAQASDT